jgi:uncharacterized membrane protein YqjE
MDDPEARPGGLLGSFRRIGDSVLGLLHSRLELAALEVQEEKIRLLDLLLRVAAVVVLGIMALVAATALVAVLFWDRSPVAVLVIITVVYAGATLSFWLDLKKRLKNDRPPFADSVAEFEKDLQYLRNKK